MRVLKLAHRLTEKRFVHREQLMAQGNNLPRKFKTVSLLSDNLDAAPKRDLLIKIGRFCPKFTVFSELYNQDSYKRMVSAMTPILAEEFNHCFQSSFRCEVINQVEVEIEEDS